MATARPGWSRRAQYGLFFSFLAVIAGIIVGVILLTLSLVAPKSFNTVRGAALDVTAPITGALHEVTATAGGLFTGAGNYWDAANQNAKLKRERQAMLQRMVEAKAIFQENRQLKATLQLREREQNIVATGRIVGSSFNSPRRFAILSAGSTTACASACPCAHPMGWSAGSSTSAPSPRESYSFPTGLTSSRLASSVGASR